MSIYLKWASDLVDMKEKLKDEYKVVVLGDKGVGKTSLVTALASASAHQLVRINLSEQTVRLAGRDVP